MKFKKVYVHSKNRTEQLVKIATQSRDTYTYKFYGKETIGGKTREYVEELELIPGEDNITPEDIKKLYAAEDLEVYYNLKARRLRRTAEEKQRIAEWKEEYIRKFKAEHGYEPHPIDVNVAADNVFPNNWSISLDEILDDTEDDDSVTGDKSAILANMCSSPYSEPGVVEMMDEIASTWPDSWREIYEHVLKNGETIISFSRERGITEEAARKALNKIRKTLKVNDELRKFIRFFD